MIDVVDVLEIKNNLIQSIQAYKCQLIMLLQKKCNDVYQPCNLAKSETVEQSSKKL